MLMFLLSTFAFAQSPETPTTNVEYAKETVIDFVAAEIEGSLSKPQMVLVSDWKPAYAGSLLTLRTSFAMEMNQSIENVK